MQRIGNPADVEHGELQPGQIDPRTDGRVARGLRRGPVHIKRGKDSFEIVKLKVTECVNGESLVPEVNPAKPYII